MHQSSSQVMPSSNNPLQLSTNAMLENSNVGVALQESLNMAIGLLKGFLPPVEMKLLIEQDPHMIDALESFIRVSNLHILFIFFNLLINTLIIASPRIHIARTLLGLLCKFGY